jgi:DNA repair exonuclease SbcCD ATPase subunit
VDDFDESARRAQSTVESLLMGAEQASQRLADVRAQVVSASDRFETHWVSVLERAHRYLDQVAREEEQLTASREDARQALTGLRAALEDVHEHGPHEVDEAQADFDEAAANVAQREPDIRAALDDSHGAEASLVHRLEEVQSDLDTAVAGTEALLAQATEEMGAFQQELEHRVVQLNAYLNGVCLPTVRGRAQALYQRLVQAETEVRTTLESSLDATEGSADRALRDCRDGFGDALSDVRQLSETLEKVMFEVKVFVDKGRAKLLDDKDHWDERVRSTREGLRESLELMKEVQDYLGRYSFGH